MNSALINGDNEINRKVGFGIASTYLEPLGTLQSPNAAEDA